MNYNFNPRTHVGCDLAREIDGADLLISIHAPTWGATPQGVGILVPAIISIHAPTWGATWDGAAAVEQLSQFQSTHPRGVRQTLLGR